MHKEIDEGKTFEKIKEKLMEIERFQQLQENGENEENGQNGENEQKDEQQQSDFMQTMKICILTSNIKLPDALFEHAVFCQLENHLQRVQFHFWFMKYGDQLSNLAECPSPPKQVQDVCKYLHRLLRLAQNLKLDFQISYSLWVLADQWLREEEGMQKEKEIAMGNVGKFLRKFLLSDKQAMKRSDGVPMILVECMLCIDQEWAIEGLKNKN